MFRAPLCPSSGAHDDSVWLPHRPSVSRVADGWRLSAGRMDERPDRRLYSLMLLMTGIMMPEICSA